MKLVETIGTVLGNENLVAFAPIVLLGVLVVILTVVDIL
jgi:hypothetical protein